ncbi:hypothetical protein VNN41_09980 [Lactococcus garvieae]|uniref:hypothetical protein n=1 Tax=Lactococcus garvieae TaxID=1363 RepID=UPI003255E41C
MKERCFKIRQKVKISQFLRKMKPQYLLFAVLLGLVLFPAVASAAEPNWDNWALPFYEPNGNLFPWEQGGGITNQDEAVAFYERFKVYLTPIWGVLGPMVGIGGRLVQFLVSLPNVFQGIFFGAIKLLGIYTQLSDQQTDLGKLFIAMQKLGAIVFGLTSIIYFTYVIFNGKSKEIKKIMETAVILFCFIGFVPWGLNQIFAMTSSAITDTSKAAGEDLGLTLLQSNVVDKEALMIKKFEVDMDADDGVVKKPSDYNQITSVYGWDPGEMLGVTSVPVLETLDAQMSDGPEQNYAQNVFKSKLMTYPVTGTNGQQIEEKKGVAGIEHHAAPLTAANYMEMNYLRYKVNWLPLILSSIAISFIYIMMTIKVGTSAFVTVATVMAAPILAALKSKSPKKVKEEIGHILAGAYSVFFEFLIVVVAMYMILWINSPSAQDLLSGAGLSVIQMAFVNVLFYVGLFFGVMSGVQTIERFIGISTSHQNPMQQMASAMIVAGGISKFGGALGSSAKALGGRAMGGGGGNKTVPPLPSNGKDSDPFKAEPNKNDENPYHPGGASGNTTGNNQDPYGQDNQGTRDTPIYGDYDQQERLSHAQDAENAGASGAENSQDPYGQDHPADGDTSGNMHHPNSSEPIQEEFSGHLDKDLYGQDPNSRPEVAPDPVTTPQESWDTQGITEAPEGPSPRLERAKANQRTQGAKVAPENNSRRSFSSQDPFGHSNQSAKQGTRNAQRKEPPVKPRSTMEERLQGYQAEFDEVSSQHRKAMAVSPKQTMEERLQDFEAEMAQITQHHRKSEQTQSAAARRQNYQAAGSQIQSGLQRAQSASQNHFNDIVRDDED